jgi:hypothetical protein
MHLPESAHERFMPRNLAWCAALSRLAAINELMVAVGAMSMHALGLLSTRADARPDLLYQVVWMHWIGVSALLVMGVPALWSVRRAWHRMPQPTLRYAQQGAYPGLPRADRIALALCTVIGGLAAAALAWWGMHWCTKWMPWSGPAPTPPFQLAVFNVAYGTLVIYVLEYFHDRTVWSRHRERRAQQLGVQAQLDMLRSQLEPHMLFNTLANVNDLIDEDPAQAKAMLLRLIEFLRATLRGSLLAQHPLTDEFKLIADYLAIMQIRMGERLNVSLHLPPELAATPIPALLLQPLIENAIQHGVAPRRAGGLLQVEAVAGEHGVHIRIRNPGGAPAAPSTGQGMGMRLVAERLQARYGTPDLLQLRHLPDEDATQVSVWLPGSPITS